MRADSSIELLPAETLNQPPPEIFPSTYEAPLPARQQQFPPTVARTLVGAYVNHEGLVFDRWPLAVSFARPGDGDRFEHALPRIRFAVKNYLLRLPRRGGHVLWCIDNLSPDNWYHWLTEVLPRLHVARRLFLSLDYVALPAYYRRSSWIEETLAMWRDLPPVLWVPRSRRVRAEQLLVVERVAPPWSYRPDVMRDVARHMIEHCRVSDPTPGPTRIYVTRSDANWRRVANETSVRTLLEERGFTTVTSGALPIVDQVRMFSRATHVVGAHGAGLANMMFCPPGAKVLEFATTDPHQHWRCYYNLASAMHLRYGIVLSEQAGRPGASFEERRDADISVDLVALQEALDAMG